MRALVFSLIVLFGAGLADLVQAQDYPDYNELYINDFAAILAQEDEDRIRGKLVELRERRGIEFTLITINSMSNYGHTGPIEPFATGLFNYWGVGNADRNDGVMMLIAKDDRVMRIEVGSGYGTAKNVPMGNIIDTNITPKFKEGDFTGGIEDGVDAVIRDLTGNWPGEYDATKAQKAYGTLKRFLDWIGNWIFAILAPFLVIPVQMYRRWKRNKPRKCPLDNSQMHRLDEAWEDNHLQKGQITEERLKSVDYDVWQCRSCNHVTIEGYKAWFSQYGACRSCGFRTVEGDTTILESATTTSTGSKRIDYQCHNCQDSWSVRKTIPKVSSSSSSSSGSSFGGGSSSGGGSSGSW